MDIININNKRASLLAPLVEWRFLGVTELKKLSSYDGSERGLQRFIQRLENDGILKSFIHKMSNRKYVQLTRKAYAELTDTAWNINEDIKMHDAVVSTLLYKFSRQEFVTSTKINYQDIRLSDSIFSHGIDPDGMIRAKRRDEAHNVAIEVELTRKNSSEIFKKFQRYDENTSFEWVLYFFKNRRVLEAYFKYYNDFREKNKIDIMKSQVLFCHSSNLASSSFNPISCYWKRPDGADSTLGNFFHV